MELFKNIKANINKVKTTNKEYPEFDNEVYKEESELSDFVEDKEISNVLKLSLGCFGLNGIYLFFTTRLTEEVDIKSEIQSAIRILNLLVQNIVIFIRSEDKDYYYDGKNLIEKEYLLDCYSNIYKNSQLSSMTLQKLDKTDEQLMEEVFEEIPFEDAKNVDPDAKWYVANRVSDAQLNLIYKNISTYERPEANAKEIEVDGVKFAKHAVKTKIFGYSYGEQYFPVSTTNPTTFLLITLFGGMFGLHKLMTREYGKFLLYLLTFGGIGVLYVVDVLSIATGGYYINQFEYYEDDNGEVQKSSLRLYLDKVPRMTLRIASIVASVVIAFSGVKFGYFELMRYLSFKLTEDTMTKVEQMQDRINDAQEGNYEDLNNMDTDSFDYLEFMEGDGLWQ